MLLAKANTLSLKLSFHCSATSTVLPFFTPEMYTGGLNSGVLWRFRYYTKDTMPPS